MTKAAKCASCGGEVKAEGGRSLKVCPYCGKPFAGEPTDGPSPLEARLLKERNPKKKYAIIQEALGADPDGFEPNKALLFHGRLHEPMRGKGPDYSIIKCHLLSVFETPEKYKSAELAEKYEELLRGPQLQKTMALSGDPDAFFEGYLRRLAREYVELFLRGANQNSRSVFGFVRPQESIAHRCAAGVKKMLGAIDAAGGIDENHRALLRLAVRDGFVSVFPGYEGLL